MSDQSEIHIPPAASPPTLPDADLLVDFGSPAPGSTNPMPIGRRNEYEARIRNSVDAQAAGAEKASQLFIR